MGHTVSGSDLKDSPVTERLGSQGITVALGHRAENVAGRRRRHLLARGRARQRRARGRGRGEARVAPRSEMLAADLRHPPVPRRLGTHGKTTTASMLSLILVEAGLQPFVRDRGRRQRNRHQRGLGQRRVARRRGGRELRHLQGARPDLAVLTNVEPDHLDYYGTFEVCERPSPNFVAGATLGAVVCADDEHAAAIGRAARGNAWWGGGRLRLS